VLAGHSQCIVVMRLWLCIDTWLCFVYVSSICARHPCTRAMLIFYIQTPNTINKTFAWNLWESHGRPDNNPNKSEWIIQHPQEINTRTPGYLYRNPKETHTKFEGNPHNKLRIQIPTTNHLESKELHAGPTEGPQNAKDICTKSQIKPKQFPRKIHANAFKKSTHYPKGSHRKIKRKLM